MFRSGTTGPFSSSVTLPVPTNGTSVPFFAAGKFGKPSAGNGDVTIQARNGTTLVGSAPVMVRIRKNANALTTAERNRFVAAFAQLNNQGLGRFADFRNMHTNVSSPQAHGAPGFLPWHRAYLLDLERELQAIDPSVALPYWRFDQPAPNIFTPDFLGASDALSVIIRFSLVQIETPDDKRGRVSAINYLFVGSSNTLGEFESGMVREMERSTLTAG